MQGACGEAVKQNDLFKIAFSRCRDAGGEAEQPSRDDEENNIMKMPAVKQNNVDKCLQALRYVDNR